MSSRELNTRWIIALLVMAFLGGMTAYIVSVIRGAEPAPSKQIALCSDEPGINEKINTIAFEALDNSLKQQIGHLLLTWLKDDTGQPARAKVGVEQAVYAYLHARQAIISWNVPPCPPR